MLRESVRRQRACDERRRERRTSQALLILNVGPSWSAHWVYMAPASFSNTSFSWPQTREAPSYERAIDFDVSRTKRNKAGQRAGGRTGMGMCRKRARLRQIIRTRRRTTALTRVTASWRRGRMAGGQAGGEAGDEQGRQSSRGGSGHEYK